MCNIFDTPAPASVQAAAHGPSGLRCLDITGNKSLADASIAALLGLCPQLRVLHAADTALGAASMAALAGRQQRAAEAQPPGQHAQRQHCRQHPGGGSTEGGDEGKATGAASALERMRLAPAAAEPSPACPLLEQLDVSGCSIKGSALRRALRCLPRLTDLRLCSALHAVLDPLASDDAGGSSKAARASQMLGQLSRLEALDADDLSSQHIRALLQHCTGLRRLALHSKQLAAERPDWRHMAAQPAGCSAAAGGSSPSSSSLLPLLSHLDIGWGTGGSFLLNVPTLSSLYSLVCHPGAALSDWHLQQAAPRWPYLARLALRSGNVSDAGRCLLATST